MERGGQHIAQVSGGLLGQGGRQGGRVSSVKGVQAVVKGIVVNVAVVFDPGLCVIRSDGRRVCGGHRGARRGFCGFCGCRGFGFNGSGPSRVVVLVGAVTSVVIVRCAVCIGVVVVETEIINAVLDDVGRCYIPLTSGASVDNSSSQNTRPKNDV